MSFAWWAELWPSPAEGPMLGSLCSSRAVMSLRVSYDVTGLADTTQI